MSSFPDSIDPPDSVYEARVRRQQGLSRAILWGVGIRASIIIAEWTSAFLTGSNALFLDGLSSLLDILCSCLLLLFIKIAERPPDREHPFGHGRFEPLAGLQLGVLLIVIGLGTSIQQIFEVVKTPTGIVADWAWIVPLAALLFLEISYAIATRAAKKYHSPALATEAAHFRIDSLSSLLATIALLTASYFPTWSQRIDHFGAIAIGLFMFGMGIYGAIKNVNQLLDRAPDLKYFKKVRESAKAVSGVMDTEKILIQLYGPDAQVNIDIEVDPQLSVEEAHRITQKVRAEIQKGWPAVRGVTVHVEPYYPDDH